MGFGRRRDWERNKGREGKSRPKLVLVGGIVLTIGILILFYGNIRDLYIALGGVIAVIIGTLILLFSLSKRNKIRFERVIDLAVEFEIKY